jgi:hypothetical protein
MARSFSGKTSRSKPGANKQAKVKTGPVKVEKAPSMFVNHGAVNVKITKQK